MSHTRKYSRFWEECLSQSNHIPGPKVRFNLTAFDSSLVWGNLHLMLGGEKSDSISTIPASQIQKWLVFYVLTIVKYHILKLISTLNVRLWRTKPRPAPASLFSPAPGWQIFSHWDSALLNDIMKPRENTHEVKQTQIVVSSSQPSSPMSHLSSIFHSGRRQTCGRLVYCQVQCVTKDHVTWNVWRVTKSWHPGPVSRGKISKLQYCVARLSSEASRRGYWGHGWSVSPQNKPRLRDGPSLKYSMLGRDRLRVHRCRPTLARIIVGITLDTCQE